MGESDLICIRKGCKKKVPEIAIRHRDSYCSTECAKFDHGVITELPEHHNNQKTKTKSLDAEKIKHGTINSYQKYKCKCQLCLKAGRDYHKLQVQRRREKFIKQQLEREFIE
jgi:hypothetical protein